ncbi:MAG: tetratricopeptide repeat-containing sensor histidine kinase [Bacteroidota bacterium]
MQFFVLKSQGQSDTLVINNYLDSAKSLANQEKFVSSFLYATKSIALSKKINNAKFLGKSYLLRAWINEKQGKIKDASIDYENAINNLSAINDTELLADAYNTAGHLFGQRGKSAKGLTYLLKGLRIVKGTKNIELHSKILSNIAIIYFYCYNYESAKKYLQQSIALMEKSKKQNQLAHLYGNLAMVYKQTNIDSLALLNYNKALKICEIENDLECVAKAYNNMGVFFQDKKQFNPALYYFKKSLEIAEENKLVNVSLISAYNIGKVYYNLNKNDSIKYFADITLNGAKVTKSFEDYACAYELYYKYFENKQNYENALEYFKLYKIERDSILMNSNSQTIYNVELKNEFEQIESERLIQEQKNKTKWNLDLQQKEFENKFFLLFSLSLSLFCGMLFFYFKKAKKDNEKITNTNNELQEINREKDALMGIVAHDLRTPISQIKGLVKLLEMELNVSSNQIEIIENLNKAITHGDVLILELLELNNIENQNNTEFEPIEIKKVLNESINQFAMELKKKQLTLISSIDKDVNVLCREDWLYRIFNNFFSNAIKFSPFNKTIEIKMNLIENNSKVEVVFIDQGAGISENEIPLLFKKFQRLSNKPTGDETSTGLGLFITKVIADKCNAKLFCESTVGVGTIFKVVFDVYKI